MPEHGGHAEQAPAQSPKSGKGGSGVGKAFVGAIGETINKVFAEPMANVGLTTVNGIGEIVEAGTNLGVKPAKGGSGGSHGGGGHH
jgi:hypothetical protein